MTHSPPAADLPPAATSPVPGGLQILAAIIAVALIVTGAAAVFTTNNSTGSGSLVAAGAAIGALAMFANRIQSVDAAGIKLQLTQAAVSSLQAAQQADRQGHSDIAATLRDHADRLLSAAAPIGSK